MKILHPRAQIAAVAAALSFLGVMETEAQAGPSCAEAFEQGQTERVALNYTTAKQSFITCSQPTCSRAIANECEQFLALLQRETPSIGFHIAASDTGAELFDVRVTLDGKLITSKIDGTTVEINPGVHSFKFEAADYKPLDTKLSILSGERSRVISVELESLHPVVAANPALPTAPPPRPLHVPVATWVAGGVGLAALGGFGIFHMIAANDYKELQSTCSPACSDDQIDPVRSKYTVSQVLLGVSGVAFATGVVTFFALQPKKEGPTVALRWDGNGASLAGRF